MLSDRVKDSLRFYFITDDNASALTPVEQVTIALKAGATMIQYRNKSISPQFFKEIITIKNMCKTNHVPFLINDISFLPRLFRLMVFTWDNQMNPQIWQGRF